MPMPYPGPLGNLVLETANAPGTASTINLGGAPSGWTGFVAAFGTGKPVFYFMSDGVQAEWGTGTVTAGSLNTLSRGVAGNSQGTTQRLNFTGTVQVYSAIPAEWQPHFDVSNGTLPMGGRRLSGMAAGVAADDGVRLDQVGWRVVGNVAFTSPQAAVVFSIPSLSRFRLEWQDLVPAAAAGLYLRYSFDGGTTFRSDATAYSTAGSVATSAGVGLMPAVGDVIALTPFEHGAGPAFGTFEFQQSGMKAGVGQSFGLTSDARNYRASFAAWSGIGGNATHVLLGFIGNRNCNSGRVRLLGAHQ